jgi:hypothetical protein
MGTGSLTGVKLGRGVTLIPHPLLVTWPRKSRAIPLLPVWAVRPVQSLSACTRAHVTFYGKVYRMEIKLPSLGKRTHLTVWQKFIGVPQDPATFIVVVVVVIIIIIIIIKYTPLYA